MRLVRSLPHLNWLPVMGAALGICLASWACESTRMFPADRVEPVSYLRFFVPAFVALLFIAAGRGTTPSWLQRTNRSRTAAGVFLTASSIAIVAFILHFGNRQFGAWDYGIGIDTGWRQMLGQRPYLDFMTPLPSGFNIGCYLAFRLLGVSWNSYLEATAVFAVTCHLWTYWLYRRAGLDPIAAWFFSLTLVSLTFGAVSFWWYNSATQLLGSILICSTAICLRQTKRVWAPWISFSLSLGFVVLQKPNLSAPLALFAMGLLLLGSPGQRLRALAACTGGVLLAIGILLSFRVPLGPMLQAFHGAAIERGGLSQAGISVFDPLDRLIVFIPVVACSLPLLILRPGKQGDAPVPRSISLAESLLCLIPCLLAIYGIRTDNEFRCMQATLVIATAALLAFRRESLLPSVPMTDSSKRTQHARVVVLAAAASCMLLGIVLGVQRVRVEGIGQHLFYEPASNDIPIHDDFFSSLTATPRMQEVQEEVHFIPTLPRPVFFGPRLEFEYAVTRLPSPRDWPVFFQPGTSFARAEQPKLIAQWQAANFATVVSLHDDWIYYPPELVQVIHSQYTLFGDCQELRIYLRNDLIPKARDAQPCRTPVR